MTEEKQILEMVTTVKRVPKGNITNDVLWLTPWFVVFAAIGGGYSVSVAFDLHGRQQWAIVGLTVFIATILDIAGTLWIYYDLNKGRFATETVTKTFASGEQEEQVTPLIINRGNKTSRVVMVPPDTHLPTQYVISGKQRVAMHRLVYNVQGEIETNNFSRVRFGKIFNDNDNFQKIVDGLYEMGYTTAKGRAVKQWTETGLKWLCERPQVPPTPNVVSVDNV